jgi:hypothetical protein
MIAVAFVAQKPGPLPSQDFGVRRGVDRSDGSDTSWRGKSEVGRSDSRTSKIQRNLDQYRRPTAARTLNGLVKELRPSDYSTFVPDLINQYVELLLGLMLALGREPSLMYNTVGAALFRARQLEGVGLDVK